MSTQRPLPIPLKPTPTDAATYLRRAVFAQAIHATRPFESDPVEIAKSRWPDDSITPRLLSKAATVPATTTTSTWATELALNSVGAFVASLAPLSAAASLFAVATRVSLAGINSVQFPQRSGAISTTVVPWIPEGGSIPVTQLQISRSVQLGPATKLAIAVVATRELVEYANGQAVLSLMLSENAAAALDTTLFGNAAAVAGTSPAGLLNGLTGLTPATAGTDAMNADLSALATAISPVSNQLAYVCNPAQAAAIRIRRVSPLDAPVFSSIFIPAKTVIAVAPDTVVSAFGVAPDISSADAAVLQLETAPAVLLGTPGSPNVIAAPSKSMFQHDLIAIKLILRAAWCLRAPGVAFMQNVTW
jgi:hypothetical protein